MSALQIINKGIMLAILIGIGAMVQAQGPGRPDQDRLKSMRVAYMTEKLDLTPAEAEKFWPIYNEYQAAHEGIEKRARDDSPDLATMSDQELEDHIRSNFDRMESLIDLKRSYLDKFKTVLPQRKAAMVFAVEHEFIKEIVRFKHSRGDGSRLQQRREGMRRNSGG